jgi:hypothetical protein
MKHGYARVVPPPPAACCAPYTFPLSSSVRTNGASDTGQFVDVDIANCNVAIIFESPVHLYKGDRIDRLYIDERTRVGCTRSDILRPFRWTVGKAWTVRCDTSRHAFRARAVRGCWR